METKISWTDVPVAPEQKSTEDRLGHHIENSIENSLGIRMDDVASLGNTPSNRVQEPQTDGQDTASQIDPVDSRTKSLGVLARHEHQDIHDVQEGNHAEGEETPLVARRDKRTNKTSSDHDLVHQDRDEKCRPRESRSQKQVQQQERCRDDPIDVANVEDLTGETISSARGAEELDIDGCLAQVGSHGEVRYGGDEGDGGGDVVEDAVGAGFGEAETQEDKGGDGHDGADGEVPGERSIVRMDEYTLCTD